MGEDVDMFGIVLFGSLRVGDKLELKPEEKARGEKIHYLKIGDMFGHQNLAEQNGVFGEDKWRFGLTGETDGVMAILPYGEVKQEIRRAPKAIYKVLEIAANQALETNYYNIVGASRNPTIKFNPQSHLVKKTREFFLKNPVFRTFLQGIEKRDERIFMTEIQS